MGTRIPAGTRAVIGVISDTHGLLRDEAVDALRGVDCIIHAGDVGRADILGQLALIGPVTAVRGNIDRGEWAENLPLTDAIEVGFGLIYVLHDVHDLDLDPQAASVRLIVSGHSHQPSIREDGGVTFLNPGSAGPRRFKLPVSVARVEIDEKGGISARLIELPVCRPEQNCVSRRTLRAGRRRSRSTYNSGVDSPP